ncbi:MAG: arylsulfotransferase family protein [Planctomycetota bacterium]
MRRTGKLLAALLLIGAGFGWGVATQAFHVFPYQLLRDLRSALRSGPEEPIGRWHELRSAGDDDLEENLAGHPYLRGYQEARERSGAFVRDRERVCPGLTLFTSGHAPTILLVDIDGEVVHEWRTGVDEVWPDGLDFKVHPAYRSYIRRGHPFPNGDILAIFEYIGVARLARDGKPIWGLANQAHHDVAVFPDGTLVTLVRRYRSPDELSAAHPGIPFVGEVKDDRVAFVSSTGEELRSFSLLDALLASDYASLLGRFPRLHGDLLHANSVDIVGPAIAARYPFADEGDVLVSVRSLDSVVVLDGKTGRVRWVATGQWRAQHQAQFLANGNILLFDNRGAHRGGLGDPVRSRAVEFDLLTREIVWQYAGRDLHSHSLGSVRRLPNGNTLITESTQGRILEVTPDGKLVWEYVSPHRTGKNDRLIATIMGARRIDPGMLTFR